MRNQQFQVISMKLLLAIAAVIAVGTTASVRPAFGQGDARKGVIFVDSSASVRDFGEAYRQSMRGIAAKAREAGRPGRSSSGQPTQIYFVPISDGADLPTRLPNTSMRDATLSQALAQPFRFSAQTTQIAKSLRAARRLGTIDEVMIVSDLVPDHRASGGPFEFSRQDMADLIETKVELIKLLESEALQTMGLLMLGWERAPAEYLSRAERENPDSVIAQARRANQRWSRRNRNAGPEREDGRNRQLYEKAVAAVVVSLQKAFPEKVRVTPMRRTSGGTRNEQGFFIFACTVFESALSGDPRCAADAAVACVPGGGGSGRVQSEFTLGVNLGRYRFDGRILAILRNKFAAELQSRGLVVPRRIRLVTEADQAASADFKLKLCVVSARNRRRCAARGNPRLRSLGWTLEGRMSNGSETGEIVPVTRVVAGGANRGQAILNALANDVARKLETHLRDNFRAPQSVLSVILKSSAGRPMPRGHKIRADYKLGGSSSGNGSGDGQSDTAHNRVIDETGAVVFHIPRQVRDLRLTHIGVRANEDGTDSEIALGEIDQNAVGSCQIYNHQIPENLFVPYKLAVTWPSEQRFAQSSKKGRLSVRLVEQGSLSEEQAIAAPAISGDEVSEVSLPPGRYEVTLQVGDQRMDAAGNFAKDLGG